MQDDKAHVIVIEDDDSQRWSLTRYLERNGHRVDAFAEAGAALELLARRQDVALVVTDLMMPGHDGFHVLARARELDPTVGVLAITGNASVDSAVEFMKRGGDDYLTKPVNLDVLRKRVQALVDKWRLSRRVDELETRLGEKFRLVGRSKVMEDLFRQLELVAPARTNVLIVGESGTGKELVANALHEHSPRRAARFLPINCAAIPAEILESELFGHERGAFTGATGRKIGKFELADKGTLFLDEIGELPVDMQVKLLRVLEQREFMRVGGEETIHVDIRLIAATNSSLEAAVDAGRFRSDLYYRLKVVTLRVPPLRERPEDVPLLAGHFLEMYARENGRTGMRFHPDVVRLLRADRWEGNVRELRNLVESLVVLAPRERDEVRVEDLPAEFRSRGAAAALRESAEPALARR
ncbi:MAG TPA: sigma-54 dependent transcriptional regulator, partial [Candidatus Polarisedimenticolaceae bacterium]|nr:sigma-54 dependent transcriptional regulator [Candidatus Polarisedimenticolaceae bacterium]